MRKVSQQLTNSPDTEQRKRINGNHISQHQMADAISTQLNTEVSLSLRKEEKQNPISESKSWSLGLQP